MGTFAATLQNISLPRRFPTPSSPSPWVLPQRRVQGSVGRLTRASTSTGSASQNVCSLKKSRRSDHSEAKKRASDQSQLSGRQKRLSRACREGKPARDRPHLRLDGALPIAAAVRHHLARPMSCDRWSESALQTLDDRLRHQRTVPLGFACGHRRGDRQLQHCGVLTFAQLGQ